MPDFLLPLTLHFVIYAFFYLLFLSGSHHLLSVPLSSVPHLTDTVVMYTISRFLSIVENVKSIFYCDNNSQLLAFTTAVNFLLKSHWRFCCTVEPMVLCVVLST